MRSSNGVWLLVAFCLVVLGSTRSFSQKKKTHAVHVSLGVLLTDLGNKYDRYFTIEDTINSGEVPLRGYTAERECPWAGTCDTTSATTNSATAELDLLVGSNPNIQYVVDKGNPKIIHIISDRLASRSDYPMGQTLNSVQFEGTTWDLVKYLHERGFELNYMANGLGLESAVDVRTKVAINVRSATVRGILSDFIPLDAKRSRILWVSQTELRPSAVVDIWYPLLMSQKP